MTQVGTEIAKMHMADVIHGDLTTSNMMVRPPSGSSQGEVVCLFYYVCTVCDSLIFVGSYRLRSGIRVEPY